MNWHHQNTRRGSTEIFRDAMLISMGVARPGTADKLPEKAAKVVQSVSRILEFWLNMNQHNDGQGCFLMGSSTPTIVDLSCYSEMYQLEVMGVLDFASYPQLKAWMQRMKVS